MHVEYGICWWWPRVSTQHLGPKWNPESSSDDVCLEHVYREANDVADPLSNNAKTRELGYHFFNEPPEKS
uniref:Uncharacterized protein n=1 Tax=Gossypium raimondii TaxID=29730 RepID=A0A0D2SLS6_GOSRA|nr:hypothetical protein B456_005G223600 [Gossypium raimondii]